jgi:hypothetical protein
VSETEGEAPQPHRERDVRGGLAVASPREITSSQWNKVSDTVALRQV